MTDLRRRIDELIRKWSLLIEETIETESSVLAFGVRGDQPIVLKVIKSDHLVYPAGARRPRDAPLIS